MLKFWTNDNPEAREVKKKMSILIFKKRTASPYRAKERTYKS